GAGTQSHESGDLLTAAPALTRPHAGPGEPLHRIGMRRPLRIHRAEPPGFSGAPSPLQITRWIQLENVGCRDLLALTHEGRNCRLQSHRSNPCQALERDIPHGWI